MGLQDRENQRKSNSVVGAIINNANLDIDSNVTITSGERGKNSKGEKQYFKARSYYLTEELYKAVGIKAALTGVDKSSVVRDALNIHLKDILEEYK